MTRSLDPGPTLTWRLLKYRRLIALWLVVLAADQATKAWVASAIPYGSYGEGSGAVKVVPGFLYIVHVGNTGAAWSSFTGKSIPLAILAVATLVAIFVWRKDLELSKPRTQFCFGLLCGGITGNLVDRILRGHVVDFLDFQFGSYHWPAFNVADSCICVAAGLLLISGFSSGGAEAKKGS